LAAKNLSDAEQNYLIAHASLLERSMSLRGLQGQGAGSDQQRQAIAAMVPNLVSANKSMIERQLKVLENNVSNVESAIPKIGKRSTASAGESAAPVGSSTPPNGATLKVPGSDGKLHWSDGKQDLGVVQ
jgi:hypothetical protein